MSYKTKPRSCEINRQIGGEAPLEPPLHPSQAAQQLQYAATPSQAPASRCTHPADSSLGATKRRGLGARTSALPTNTQPTIAIDSTEKRCKARSLPPNRRSR